MAQVILYTTEQCPYCVRAKSLLDSKQVTYSEIRVDLEPEARIEMMEKSGRRSVPQIFIDERAMGGYDDLVALDRRGELDPLLV